MTFLDVKAKFTRLLFIFAFSTEIQSYSYHSYFNLEYFEDCVFHVTTFHSSTKFIDVVQSFIQSNQVSIWTFTNTTNDSFPIQPTPHFYELCSVNILLNSDSID